MEDSSTLMERVSNATFPDQKALLSHFTSDLCPDQWFWIRLVTDLAWFALNAYFSSGLLLLEKALASQTEHLEYSINKHFE